MDHSKTTEITHDFPPFFKVYNDGRIQRYTFMVRDHIPASLDPETGVQTKDVMVSIETGVRARIFIPKLDNPDRKVPIFVHYHAGGFCVGSAFDILTKNFLTPLVSEANVIAISIEYRLAPEHILPIASDDSWVGLQWVASHATGLGPEPWLNDHADFGRVFLGDDSAGAGLFFKLV